MARGGLVVAKDGLVAANEGLVVAKGGLVVARRGWVVAKDDMGMSHCCLCELSLNGAHYIFIFRA